MRKILFLFVIAMLSAPFVAAQDAPLTQAEFVKMLYAVSGGTAKRDELVEAVRARGLGFELTSGLRGLISTKSRNDELLKRTVDEAARRKANPTEFTPPNAKEAAELLTKAKEATLAAVEEMPDFVVKQLVSRAYAYAGTNSWKPSDKLTLAVSYSADKGENYKVLMINGAPQVDDDNDFAYAQVGGTTSAGEFVTVLKSLFETEAKTEFSAVDTDTLRGRKTIVYEFTIKRANSKQRITSTDIIAQSTISGIAGRIWIDRENNRILKIESTATEIPGDFPVTAVRRNIDYDWVKINNIYYLLPSLSEVRLTSRYNRESVESRNLIAFRNYQKYGAEVRIIDEDEEPLEEEPKKP